MDSANNGGGGSSNSNGGKRKKKRKNQRAVNGMLADVADSSGGTANLDQSPSGSASAGGGKWKNGISAKARSLMNLHNNEAGRRVSFCIHHKKIRKQIKSNIEKFVWEKLKL